MSTSCHLTQIGWDLAVRAYNLELLIVLKKPGRLHRCGGPGDLAVAKGRALSIDREELLQLNCTHVDKTGNSIWYAGTAVGLHIFDLEKKMGYSPYVKQTQLKDAGLQ